MSSYMSNCCIANDDCEYIRGNVTEEIEVKHDMRACEIRADIQVDKISSIRIWGQVTDCENGPVGNALVKLVKVEKNDCGKTVLKGVAHGVTDCMGFYQFDIIKPKNHSNKYRIFVSKQASGKEIYLKKVVCDPCSDDDFCEDYDKDCSKDYDKDCSKDYDKDCSKDYHKDHTKDYRYRSY